MNDYAIQLMTALAAPTVAMAILGAIGKWYLDRVMNRQTSRLEATLDQETERLKIALSEKVALTQARLQSLQQLSKSVYRARREFRNLNDTIFPQSDAASAIAKKRITGNPQQFSQHVWDMVSGFGAPQHELEEQLLMSEEHVTQDVRNAVIALIRAYEECRNKLYELFSDMEKDDSFSSRLAGMMEVADTLGREVSELLTERKRDLLSPQFG